VQILNSPAAVSLRKTGREATLEPLCMFGMHGKARLKDIWPRRVRRPAMRLLLIIAFEEKALTQVRRGCSARHINQHALPLEVSRKQINCPMFIWMKVMGWCDIIPLSLMDGLWAAPNAYNAPNAYSAHNAHF